MGIGRKATGPDLRVCGRPRLAVLAKLWSYPAHPFPTIVAVDKRP